MSGYDKNQHYVYDAEATRSDQIPSYPGVAQPEFTAQYTDTPTRLPHEHSTAEMPFLHGSTYESRGAGGHQHDSSLIGAASRHPASRAATETVITDSITPTEGTAGSTVSLQLRTNYDLAANQHTFILMFGSKKCVAALQKINYDDDWHNYVLNVEVPPFPLTNLWDPTMMLKLQIEDKMGHLRSQADAGKFTFTDMSPNLTYQSPPDFSRKRKYSTEFGDTLNYSDGTLAKRPNTQRFQAKPRSVSATYSTAHISPLLAQSSPATSYGRTGGYDMGKQTGYTSQLSQKGLYAIPSGMGMTQGEYKLPQMSPSLHSYSNYNPVAHPSRSPTSIAVNPPSLSVLPSPSAIAAPVLVRATTLPQAGSSTSTQPFNPYTMYQTKAILKIDGDLDKMSDDWTQEESGSKRRLVEFQRSQHGSTITTSFAPITPEARPARSICVSCIWWEDKDECFITSVDTIYLLEQLVNVRFTVEEKNRIRRNLEGFRPLTVSKAKPDSEEFFKVIMGFPNPKPRNIEKDVKVFPWKILSHALKKIISKYSASYSSTAGIGTNPTTSTATYVPSAMSQVALDPHRNTSPRSVAASTASATYTPILTSSSLSPPLKLSAGLDVSGGHGISIAQRPPSGQGMTQWGPPAVHIPQYSTGLSQGGRGSWDYGYLNTSSATGVPAVAHSLQMPRTDATPDLSHLSADAAYSQYGERTTRV